MNPCDSIDADLDAFRDGMLGKKRENEIQNHLKTCVFCNSKMKQSADLEQALKENAATWIPPENLWSRIQSSVSQQKSTQQSSPKFYNSRYSWMAAAMMLLTISLLFSMDIIRKDASKQTDPVAAVLVNEFHTFVISRRNLDFVDNQPAAIREWFGSKVDFRAPKPIQVKSMQLAGGRLCNMLNQRIASYMYRSNGAWVSLYIMKSEPVDIDQSYGTETVVQGYGYIGWEINGLHYSLVGDIDVDRLRQFANELKAT